DAELVRCYYSDENFERLARAEELGRERGVPATAIALAYVLHQKFPTFPLFGPRSIAEMRSATLGLGVGLSPEEMDWLDRRASVRGARCRAGPRSSTSLSGPASRGRRCRGR